MNYKKTFIISLLIMLTVGLYSVTHYVSNDGSDDNPGTASSPWLTIHHAVEQTEDGGLIILKPGDYEAAEVINKSLTIRGQSRDDCRITSLENRNYIFRVIGQSPSGSYNTFCLNNLTLRQYTAAVILVTTGVKSINNNVQIDGVRFTDFTTAIDVTLPSQDSLHVDDEARIANCIFNNIGMVVHYQDPDADDSCEYINISGSHYSLPVSIYSNTFDHIEFLVPTKDLHVLKVINLEYVNGKVNHNKFIGDLMSYPDCSLIYAISRNNKITISNNIISMCFFDHKPAPEFRGISIFIPQTNFESKVLISGNMVEQLGYPQKYSSGIFVNIESFNIGEIIVDRNLCSKFDNNFNFDSANYCRCAVKATNNTSINAYSSGYRMRSHPNFNEYVRNNVAYNNDDIYDNPDPVTDFMIIGRLDDPDVTLYYNAFEKEPISDVECRIDSTCIYQANLRDYFDEDNKPLSTSPTIDAGDPNLDGDAHGYYGDIDDQDPDGTRLDMGCYPYTHTYDEKHFHGGYNWVGFPRLRGTNGTEEINDVLPYTTTHRYTLLSFLNNDNVKVNLPYDNDNYVWGDNILLNSISGYKLSDSLDFFADYQNYGTRIDPATTFGLYSDMPVGNWVDYFVPYAQNIKDAFGQYFDRVESVQGEDWFYHVPPETPRGEEQELYIWKTEGKDLEFGKAYVVVVNKDIPQFQWQSSYTVSTPNKPEKTLFFNYRDKPDYETVEIAAMDSLENVQEIGVFEDGVCVGAKKFTGLPMQILCYTDRVNRSDSPLSIQVYTGSRSNSGASYLTYDESEGQFSAAPILAGRQDYSIVRLLGNQSTNQAPSVAMMSQNYPNPFSSTTRISCYLPKAQKVKVSVYNVKGQIIRTLDDTNKASGKFEIEWDGKNDSGQNVANGVYFYRLETKSKTILKKMLYLK